MKQEVAHKPLVLLALCLATTVEMTKKAFIRLLCLLVLLSLCYQGANIFFTTTSKKAIRTNTATIDYEDYSFKESNEPTTSSTLSTTASTVKKNAVRTSPLTPGTSISVEEKVEKCMRMANLNSEPLLTQARVNARYLLDEYRAVIPAEGLPGHKSHCWQATYTADWIESSKQLYGRMGNVSYSIPSLVFYPYSAYILPFIKKSYPSFKSSVVCLPKVFVIGYEKCGSTFIFSVIDNLISMSTDNWKQRQIAKEPQFWARFEAYEPGKIHLPTAGDLGRYVVNYIPGIHQVSTQNRTDVVMIDGTPNYATEWPVFTKNNSNMSNYCLLPAALPTLLPDSKYVAILRNPIDMVYSNFWWSCAKNNIPIPNANEGPDIFHSRITAKIHTFNNCMKNESVASIASPCPLDESYGSCIKTRMHLLDQCAGKIVSNQFSPEMPKCGESSLYYGMYYVHIRKWLSAVGRENLLVLTLEELNQFPSKVAGDILTFLDLNTTIATREDLVKRAMKDGDMNTKKQFDYKSKHMRNDTKAALESFYHPFNDFLTELLMDKKYTWF